ncbi:acyl-CoA desaturase [Rothia sp. AR01]|uniref:Acyl-CoA desaturase n=1 Tax=Rothia santali TaxID=2949643 RepID=A0A9X2KGS6_9MICC|nr:acyl-CoA desaturase [Rothia santali]MCP3425152.1 acyl-CoA desaturase [Rothia santali]
MSAQPGNILEEKPRLGASARRGVGAKAATSDFAALKTLVVDAGLLHRTPRFYTVMTSLLLLSLAGCITGFVLLGDSWYQLILAGVLGVLMTQLSFLGHEAVHKQIFSGNKLGDWFGLIVGNLFVGLSIGWWTNKHNRHHAAPNTVGKDPDIYDPVIAFTPEQAQARTGWSKKLTARQGYLFFPLLLLEGLNLYRDAIITVCTQKKLKRRRVEIALLLVRLVLLPGLVFWFLPWGLALAFLGVQIAVWGFYMGASFAPNHKGMPQIQDRATINFLMRQVTTSRNIVGTRFNTYLMGGLNFQIEHHLFPSMPRPHLRRAQEITRDFCAARGINYHEVTLLQSYAAVVQYLNRVGLGARDPFDCPMAGAARGI